MSKRSSQVQRDRRTSNPSAAAEGITLTPSPDVAAGAGVGGPRGRGGLWLAVGLLVPLGLGVAVFFASRGTERPTGSRASADAPGRWVPPEWAPASAEDRLIDAFVRGRRAGDRKALGLLGSPPVPAGPAVSEAEAEVLQADSFLRADLKIVEVWPGEPDGTGRQKPAPGLYTLVTKGANVSPPLAVRVGDKVVPPSQRFMTNPDLVVEVRGGKIYAVRAELHMGP
jgi:hypothetical protein